MGDQIHERRRAIEEPGHRRRPARVFLEEAGVDAQRRSNRLPLARFLDVKPERETGGVGPGDPVVAGPGKEPWVREPRNLDRTVRETVVEPKSLFPKPLLSRRRVHTVTDSAKVPEGRTTQWFRVVPKVWREAKQDKVGSRGSSINSRLSYRPKQPAKTKGQINRSPCQTFSTVLLDQRPVSLGPDVPKLTQGTG